MAAFIGGFIVESNEARGRFVSMLQEGLHAIRDLHFGFSGS